MHIEIEQVVENQKEILHKLENIGLSDKKYKKYKKLFFNGTLTPQQEKELIKILEKKQKCENEIKKSYALKKENEKILRQLADLQNNFNLLQKEEKIKLEKKEEEIIKSILPILDTLELALELALEHSNNKNDAFTTGIQNIIKKFYSVLENHGILPVENKEFNPEIHQAVSTDNDETKPEGTITKIYQKGFKKGNKVIRPSLVSVNKKTDK